MGRRYQRLSSLCDACCFFFSSRRRHTRSKRDWSSDVCSSDLEKGYYFTVLVFGLYAAISLQKSVRDRAEGVPVTGIYYRSEERRVGKECRSRWWPERGRRKERSEW